MESPDFNYDSFFLDILQEKKSIVDFLKTIFSFLARRTDFYYVSKSETEGIGFPPGVKERIVQDVLQQCDPNNRSILILENETTDQEFSVAEEVEVESDLVDEIPQKPLYSKLPTADLAVFQQTEYYNGACYENYCWSQTINDIDLHVLLPEHISSSKQLNIKIEPDRITIVDRLKAEPAILFGKMTAKCRSSDAVWSISNRKLQITLDKVKETWWEQFLDTEPKIDLSKMDCSRPLEELPEESQAVIEKLRWDQQQKALGLPTSEDIKNHKLLETAWNAEGSPFKGQPFDPTSVRFS